MEKIGKIWNKLEKFETDWKNLAQIEKIGKDYKNLNKLEIAKNWKQLIFAIQTISWSAYRLKVFQSCCLLYGHFHQHFWILLLLQMLWMQKQVQFK